VIAEVAVIRALRLADRGDRLAAALVDGVSAGIANAVARSAIESSASSHALVSWCAHSIIPAYVLLQIGLLSVRGQTIGKILYGLRIVRASDNARAGLVRAVLLRSLVPSISASPFAPSTYMQLGDWGLAWPAALVGLIALCDCLFIFRDDRRCLHELIAGTKVVRVLRAVAQSSRSA
jgi:uncharacterized RDD family membrane protein YckC